MLAVVYKGVAIPVYWLLLNKRGNSATRERIALMKRFIHQFGKTHLIALLADREFIGSDWFAWLKHEGIDFHSRIKKNALLPNNRGVPVQAKYLFQSLKAGETKVIQGTGVIAQLTGLRLADGELLLVASSSVCPNALEAYAKRWQIETLFGCLKGRGFNLEDTHITSRLRLKRLLVVPVIAFCWAHRTGEWQQEHIKPIPLKNHQRFEKSIFKYGLDVMRDSLLSATISLRDFCRQFGQFVDFIAGAQ